MNQTRIFACESQPIVLEGLARVLVDSEEFVYAGAAASLHDALDIVRDQHPDIILVDQSPGLKLVFQFISDVRSTWAHCQPVLWVNELAEADCFRALQLGARGILKKTASVHLIIECLQAVSRGDVWIENSLTQSAAGAGERRPLPRLTAREKEIVHHICVGLKNKEIAEALSITAGTVKVHLMHIFEKTGVKDRFELAMHGRRLLGGDRPSETTRIEKNVESTVA